jgi:uncharacterized protein (DUF433 family)
MEERKVVSVAPLPCFGTGCLDMTRALVERTLERVSQVSGVSNS